MNDQELDEALAGIERALELGETAWALEHVRLTRGRLALDEGRPAPPAQGRGIVTPHGIAELLPADWPTRQRDDPGASDQPR